MNAVAVSTQQPEYTADGMDGYYKGCTIRINKVAEWTVGPSTRYRIQIEKGIRLWTEYANSLEDAHRIAKYTGDHAERLKL